jgi:lipopolysaccharide/colanic/teichoic acid biosynthesis glycosyltransferase
MPWIVAQYDAAERKRLRAQPGITGLWQLRGRRERPIHHDARWDLAYLRIRCLAVDLAILLETVFFVLGRRNH